MTPRKKKPGTAPAPPPGESGFTLIPKRKLIALYAAMLKCRLLERRLRAERLAKLPRMPGREAVAAGAAIDLRAGDTIAATDCGVLPGFVQQGSVQAVLAQLRKPSKAAHSGAPWEEALKRAQALKRGRTKSVVMVFCGLVEAPAKVLRRAAAKRLPVLFFCHNEKRRRNLAAAADACGLPGITVDCEDVVAIYRVTSEALGHARRGNGPTLIECRRWKVARDNKEGRGSDAMRAMKRYLAGKGLWSKKIKEKAAAEIARELDQAVTAAKDETGAASHRRARRSK